MAIRLSTITHTTFGDGDGQHVEIATTGILEGDLVFVFFNADGNSNLNDANFTPDAGFTAPASLLNTQSAPDGSSYRICYKVETAGKPATYDFVNTAFATMYPMMVVLSGRDGTVSIGSWITNTSSNSSVITAGYNSYTAASGDDVVAFASLDKTNFDAQWTYSAITGFTTAQSTVGNSHGGGWESSMYTGVLPNASAGSSTPSQTITNTSGGGNAGFANIIILAPAAGGGATTHATSGVISGQGTSLSGSASRVDAPVIHGATGSLIGQSSEIVGAASNFTVHSTSGVLDGQGSSITGSSARIVTHDANGVLSGEGSAVDGSASRAEDNEHAASGSLAGQGAALSGAAINFTVHDADGVLSGQGSSLLGVASISIEHVTSGDLIGGVSVVDGSARNGESFREIEVVTGSGFDDLIGKNKEDPEEKPKRKRKKRKTRKRLKQPEIPLIGDSYLADLLARNQFVIPQLDFGNIPQYVPDEYRLPMQEADDSEMMEILMMIHEL